MDKELFEKLKRFSILAKEVVPFDKMILFGSFVHGTPHKDSDIDVALVVKSIGKDFLTKSAELFRISRQVDSRIEPLILSPAHDKSGFLESIEKKGIIIPF
ncbi:MAG: nucleotidyltransferase domain-containing protein [Brevinematales bacterium]|nr:nucleotidyltransferase domain-containing protein [Brevinematales bacterium]